MGAKKEIRDRKRIIEEGRCITDIKRQIEALHLVRNPRLEPVRQLQSARRRDVRRWMRNNYSDYETATQLAEAANAVHRIDGNPLADETHWIWDEAIEAFE